MAQHQGQWPVAVWCEVLDGESEWIVRLYAAPSRWESGTS